MGLIYLAALAVSLAGVAVLDWRFKLAFWDSPGRAAAVLGAGVALFLAWDIAGIGLGVFQRGDSPYMTGIMLASELPVEEPVFLLLLCFCALVAWRGAERVLGRLFRTPPDEGRS